MKTHLIFMATLAVTATALGQEPGDMEGTVYDARTHTPLSEANIWITPGVDSVSGPTRGEVSDYNGHFMLARLAPGRYVAVISRVGYKRTTTVVALLPGERKTVRVDLDESPVISVEVITVANRPAGTHVTADLSREDILAQPPKDIGGFVRGLANVSSVRKSGYGLDPVVRGFKYDQLNVLIDGGVKVEGACPNRMDPPTSHVQAEDLEGIEIIKGPHTLRYGPSFGGLVNLVMVKPERYEEFTLDGNADMGYEGNGNGRRIRGTLGGGNALVDFALTGGTKDYRDYTDGRGTVIPAGFRIHDYSAKVGLNPADNQRLQVSLRQSFARDILFPSLMMDERKDDTRLLSLDYAARNLSGNLPAVSFKLFHSDVFHQMDNASKPEYGTVHSSTDVTTRFTGSRGEAGLIAAGGIVYVGYDVAGTSKTGYRTRAYVSGANAGAIYVDNVWQDARVFNAGLFGELIGSVGRYALTASARMDFNRSRSDNPDPQFVALFGVGTDHLLNASFSAGVTHVVSSAVEIALFAGRGVRSPGISERYINFLPIGLDRYDYVGNPGLRPEANNEVDQTTKILTGIGVFSATLFYSHVTEYIAPRLTLLRPRNMGSLGVKQFENLGSANLRGFELGFSSSAASNLGVSVNAGYTRGTDGATGESLPEIPPLEGHLNLSYRFLEGGLIPQLSVGAAAAQKDVSTSFGERPTPGFAVFSVLLSYRPFAYVNVAAGVDNIFNKAYYEHLNRKLRSDGMPIFEPGRSFYVNMAISLNHAQHPMR